VPRVARVVRHAATLRACDQTEVRILPPPLLTRTQTFCRSLRRFAYCAVATLEGTARDVGTSTTRSVLRPNGILPPGDHIRTAESSAAGSAVVPTRL
jgi:hypothetical protein